MSAPPSAASMETSIGADGASTRALDEDGAPITIHRVLALDTPGREALAKRLAALAREPLPCTLKVRRADVKAGFVVVERASRSLHDVLKAAPISTDEALRIARDVAHALEAARRVGLAHGALTAHAVGVTDDGAGVLDPLGLRTHAEDELSRACSAPHGRAGATHEADVYALGVLLLAARTGVADALRELSAMTDAPTAPTLDGALPTRDPIALLNAEMLAREPAWRADLKDVARRLTELAPAATPEDTRTWTDEAPRDVLGRFQLDDVIGEGAMGRVWRAHDRETGREVAVKVIARDDAPSPRALRRFKKEARILGELRHPGIAQLLEAGEDAGRLYMAVELVNGRPLGAVVRERGPLPEAEALSILADVARALVDVHGAGIIHRDLKPDNILLVEDAARTGSRTKLIDFGIARHMDESESLAMTKQGAVLGTPLYMSPEQARGAPADARSDIYSLGITLYELLCGSAPFKGMSPTLAIAAHLDTPIPSVREKRGDVRDETARLVARCVDKSPDARFADARALLAALENLMHASPSSIGAHPRAPSDGSVLRYAFEWTLRSPPSALWPYVINTDRLNQAIGLGAVDDEVNERDGERVRSGHTRQSGFDLRWREHPFEWVFERRLGVLREYTEGPLRWFKSTVDLVPLDGGGTQLVHTVTIEPRGMLGRAAAAVEIGIKSKRALERVYHRIDELVQRGTGPGAQDFFDEGVTLAPERAARLEALEGAVVSAGAPAPIVARLGEFLRSAAAMDVARIRPVALADRLGVDEDQMVRTCFLAAREGMLVPLWDLLCPSCRAPASFEDTLRALREHAHCDVCNIEFALDLSTTIELVFRVHPQLRAADTATYCLGSPVKTPHVVAQVRVAPGEKFSFEMRLEPGGYQLVARQANLMVPFAVSHAGIASRMDLALGADDLERASMLLTARGQEIVVENGTSAEQLVRVERTAVRTDILTAARAAAHPLFRQVFPDQLIDAGAMVRVSNVTFLVAEVEGSIADAAGEGDVAAFSKLYASFKALEERVVAAGGSPVKLQGEGLLAVFDRPDHAVRAALELRAGVATVGPEVAVRVGLHRGAAAAVTLNERLDYFGRSVLDAIELMRGAGPHEMLVSEALWTDAGVREVLERALRERRADAVSLEGTPRFALREAPSP